MVAVPLLRAFFAETPFVRGVEQSEHKNDRYLYLNNFVKLIQPIFNQNVLQTEENFACLVRTGNFFLVNALAFSGKS